MEIYGVFSTYELTDREKDVYAEYLQHIMNGPALVFIRYLLGDDYLKFIDILSGTTLKIPSSKSLEKYLESVRIFLYLQDNGYTEESIKTAAKMFKKTVLTTRRYAYKVCKALGIEDTLEGDVLNNYILNIKSVDDRVINKEEDTQDDIVDIEDIMEKENEDEC